MRIRPGVFIVLLALSASLLPAQGHNDALRWRSIGPFRGGRIRAMAGVASQPYTFYYAQVNGGMWKTTDAGRTWFPVFDNQPTQSIGAIAVAPSDANTIYVGSGEGLPRPDLSVGDGVYKSTDAGKTWTRLGLNDAQQIPQIAVDPTDPNRLFVAALGHPYGPSRERGIYRSTDGGKTFTPVLQKDENTGGNDVDIDPSNPNVVYANLWEQRQGPWENAAWLGNNGGLFKSTDGGTTWRQLTSGLPANVNQVNLAISPVNPNRLFAAVASNGPPPSVGLYRSDDAGETWTKITSDNRPAGRIGGGDLPVPIMHPKDANTIVMASTVSWKSTDGGVTWAPFKGAPGGEDYQNGWINPNDPNIVFLVADQGAVISLNGGESWSSWYNQPNAMLYHVAADNAFPYRLCSGQQESGSACVRSRGDYGAVSDRDWTPVGVDEYGYAAPDPLDPDIVYGGRSVTRFDRRTMGISTVGPLTGRTFAQGANPFRQVRTQPVVFSQKDPKALYFGNNVLWKTRDGGVTWKQIAPDLTRKTWEIPKSVGKYTDPALVQQRGVIYTIAPSPLDTSVIWFGTDDGQVFRTTNGGTSWQDVTPPQIGAWWKVFMIDAGHFDRATAYVAVNTLRLDDMTPHFYRTHDGGKTWTELKNSDDMTGPANALREDPQQKGLLFAATEKGVWASPDDGGTWHSIQLNLPRSAVRDLIVKDNDLAVATHGRGFWILDDISVFRHLAAAPQNQAQTALVKPSPAYRVRDNASDDMPWPKEEPVGENPPDGAPINYFINAPAQKVTLQVLDARNRVVRQYASTDSLPFRVPTTATAPVPLYWYAQPRVLPATPGLSRWFWDLHYQPIPALPGGGGRFGGGGFGGGLPINSVPGKGKPGATTPFVSPGTYTVRLIVDDKVFSQPIVVKQDPRVKTPAAAMREVYALADSLYWTARRLREGLVGADSASIATQRPILTSLTSLMMGITDADVPITASQRAAIADALKAANAVIYRRM